ncbi:MAG: hypothetical protein IT210_21485 [Armatimonadetes bacterium]|nr:hypothetical protein [Armatimonadota bacterium]
MHIEDTPSEQAAEPQDITLMYRCGHRMLLPNRDTIQYPGECILCLEARKRWRGISEEEARACIAELIREWQARASPATIDSLARQILFVLNYLAY